MKLTNCTCVADSCMLSYLWDDVSPRQIGKMMTEDDILYLQDICLTNGVHAIQVPDAHAGRSIMYTVLQSLNYYQAASCMTCLQEPPLDDSIIDLYSQVLNNTSGSEQNDAVESYFVEDFFSDFLWVELSREFLTVPLLVRALHALHSLDMRRHMPIIALSYAS